MALTDAQISAKLNAMESQISDLQDTIATMQDDIDSRLQLSELQTTSLELQELIRDNANAINSLQRRLAKILLPDETRYYLEAGDVETFKSNFSKLKAMMSKFEQLYNNLVSYATQLGS